MEAPAWSNPCRVTRLLHAYQMSLHIKQLEPDEFRAEAALTSLGPIDDLLAKRLDVVLY